MYEFWLDQRGHDYHNVGNQGAFHVRLLKTRSHIESSLEYISNKKAFESTCTNVCVCFQLKKGDTCRVVVYV